MMNKVSIILPTYNRAIFIEKAIKNCLEQSYQNIELIVVDDGSIDETKNVVDKFNDDRLLYFYKENEGLPSAINFGMKKSTGKYLTWTSDDNFFYKDAIKKMVEFMNQQDEPSFIYTNMEYIDKNEEVVGVMNSNCQNRIYLHNYIGACFMYDRKVYESIGDYDEKLRLVEDYDYWIRVHEKYPMIHLNQTLYRYMIHSESLSSTKKNEVQLMFKELYKKNRIFEKLYKDIKCYAGSKKVYIWGTGSLASRVYKECFWENRWEIEGFIEQIDTSKNVYLDKKVFRFEMIDPNNCIIIIASSFRGEVEAFLKSNNLIANVDYY
ncbi:hypothetical protein C3943_04140 [Lysinibacillus sp. B2A1]|nr:hypothetical protein C3943_04140 [Lysinibacillus sp. B2A1]